MTYQPKVYRKQGGDELVIGPGGTLTIQGSVTGLHQGNVYYADSVNGSSGNDGLSWETAKASVLQCEALMVAGDVCYAAPGHVEAVTGAAPLTLNVAGTRLVGLGEGDKKALINFTTADTAVVNVDADDITIEGFRLRCSIDGQDVMVDVDADDCTIRNCIFEEGSAAQPDVVIDIAGSGANEADRCRIEGCTFHFPTNGPTHCIKITNVQDRLVIVGNYIHGDFDTAAIGSAAVLTHVLIADNYISQLDAGDWCIEFTDAATGFCVNNRFYADAAATCLDPGSMKCVGNRMVNAIDSSDVAVPAPNTSADTIEAALWGANGITTFPAAAAPANGVSLAEALRAIYNAVSHDSAASVVTAQAGLGRMVSKTEDVNVATGDDLFTVTGKVLITALFGEVTNAIGAQPTDYKLRIKTDNVDLCAATGIDTDAVGTMYSLGSDSGDTLNGGETPVLNTAALNGKGLANRVIGLAGGSLTIESNRTAGDAGDAIVWTLWYIPLEANASVAAAA